MSPSDATRAEETPAADPTPPLDAARTGAREGEAPPGGEAAAGAEGGQMAEEEPSRVRSIRLRTLVNLRWVAVAGQTAAVAAGVFGVGLDLPLLAVAVTIAISVALNLAMEPLYAGATRIDERGAMRSLLFDVAQLAALLFLTGGLTNPFALLLLAPVTIAASVLSARSTVILASAALLAATALLVFHEPLGFPDGRRIEPPDLFLAGYWLAITLGIVFMAVYARRIGMEAARMAEALTAAQLALSREQRLTAIGALAAAAAHELGTPLATIKLVSGELAREFADDPDVAEDLRLLRAQAERCGQILQDLSAGGRDDAQVRTTPITALIEEAAGPHLHRGKRMVVRIDGRLAAAAGEAQPMVARRPEVIHGLRNLIQNAADFATETIWIDVREGSSTFTIAVGDDGPGFRPELLDHLGDPYVTTRGRGREPARAESETAYQGMGLGLFIAKTLLERTGARLVFSNGPGRAEAGPVGAVAAAVWPRTAIVAPRDGRRAALGRNPRFEEKSA